MDDSHQLLGEKSSPTLSCCCTHGLQVLCKLHGSRVGNMPSTLCKPQDGPDALKTGQSPPPFPPSVSSPATRGSGNWPPWKQYAAAAASTAPSCGLHSGLQQHDGHKTQPPKSRALPIDLTRDEEEVIFEREELAPKGEEKMRFDRLSRILADPRCRDVPAGPSRQENELLARVDEYGIKAYKYEVPLGNGVSDCVGIDMNNRLCVVEAKCIGLDKDGSRRAKVLEQASSYAVYLSQETKSDVVAYCFDDQGGLIALERRGIFQYDRVQHARPRGFQSQALDPAASRPKDRKALAVAKHAANRQCTNDPRGVKKPSAGDWRHRGAYDLKENESDLLAPFSLRATVWERPEGGEANGGRLIPDAGPAAAANQKQQTSQTQQQTQPTEKEKQLCAHVDFASRGGAVWECSICTLHNEDMHLVCDACGSHKPL